MELTSPGIPDVSALRDFLAIPYDKLEEMNLAVKEQRMNRISVDAAREERVRYLSDEKRIKALRLPDDAKDKLGAFAKTAGPGQVLEPPVATPHAFVVARGVTPARDPQAR